jgi:hypothetical protein
VQDGGPQFLKRRSQVKRIKEAIEDAWIFVFIGLFLIFFGVYFWIWSLVDPKGYRAFVHDALEDPYESN